MEVMERFKEKYMPEPNSGCWLWTGHPVGNGYGLFWYKGKTTRAHRTSLLLHGKHPPESRSQALHKCDNPACVNPDHLYWGTHADNMADKMERGRPVRGKKHHSAKLTEEDVRNIRKENLSPQKIADKYGVSRRAIRAIQSGQNWGWL